MVAQLFERNELATGRTFRNGQILGHTGVRRKHLGHHVALEKTVVVYSVGTTSAPS